MLVSKKEVIVTCPISGYGYKLPSPIDLAITAPHPILKQPLKEILKLVDSIETFTLLSQVNKELVFSALVVNNPLIEIEKDNWLKPSVQLLEANIFKLKQITVWLNAQKDISYLPSLVLVSDCSNLKSWLEILSTEREESILAVQSMRQLLREKARQKDETELLELKAFKLLSRYESRLNAEALTLPAAIATHLLIASDAPKTVYKYWFSILTKTPNSLLRWDEYNRNDTDELLEHFELWDSTNALRIVAIRHLRKKLESTPAKLTLDDINLFVVLPNLTKELEHTNSTLEVSSNGEIVTLADKAAFLLAKLKAQKKVEVK